MKLYEDFTGCRWKTVFGDTWMLREKGENYVSIWSFESPSLPTHPAPKFSINLRNNYLPMLGAGMGKLSFSHREFQGHLTGFLESVAHASNLIH